MMWRRGAMSTVAEAERARARGEGTEDVTTVVCKRCGAYIEYAPRQGVREPLIDWRTRDGQLCQSPPWPRCDDFITAYVDYVSDCHRRSEAT